MSVCFPILCTRSPSALKRPAFRAALAHCERQSKRKRKVAVKLLRDNNFACLKFIPLKNYAPLQTACDGKYASIVSPFHAASPIRVIVRLGFGKIFFGKRERKVFLAN